MMKRIINRSVASLRVGKKKLIAVIALVVVLIAAIGGTIAYIVTNTDKVENAFTPGKVTCEVEETITDNTKTTVMIKNTGNVDAYIRVAVIANTIDANGVIIGQEDMSSYLAADGWTSDGGYYYYNQPVAPGAKTGELLTQSLPLDGIQVSILAEAIQADGTNASNVKPITDAWDYTPSGN